MSVKRRFRSTNEKRASDLMEGSGTIWKVPRYRFFCRLSAKMRRGRAERSGLRDPDKRVMPGFRTSPPEGGRSPATTAAMASVLEARLELAPG